jgi:hypothetical protein
VNKEEKRKEELDGGRAFDDSCYVHRLPNLVSAKRKKIYRAFREKFVFTMVY